MVPNSLYNWILPKCNFSFVIHFTLRNLINFWLLAFSRLLTRRHIKSMYMYKHGFSTYKHTKKPVLIVRDKWKTISGCADKVKSLTRSFRGAGETNQTYIPSSDFATSLQVLRPWRITPAHPPPPPHKKKNNNNNNNWMPPVGRKDRSIDFKMSLQKNPVRVISVAVNVAVV